MHRKSLEAAQHLKESGSEREGSEPEPERPGSVSPHRDPHDPHDNQAQSSPGSSTTASSSAKGRASPEGPCARDAYDDPEAFRNNSIACLRAKAQEHQARLLSSNLLLQANESPPTCAECSLYLTFKFKDIYSI
ncbi:unnamed protein product [Diatraea saccharalis]|uniref:OAR domain-containing protein n=1 Tax=Diatraea saccharalis TaxID=40085 RepID=A0A9N9WDF4_9NEOP|nr:unnamed protein product [Diatraea saccharalis]